MQTAMIKLNKMNKIFLNILSALSSRVNLSSQPRSVTRRQSAADSPVWVGGVNVYPERSTRR